MVYYFGLLSRNANNTLKNKAGEDDFYFKKIRLRIKIPGPTGIKRGKPEKPYEWG